MQNITQGLDYASTTPADPTGRRACDQCRLRKTRCDKNWPCSNCWTAKRSCTSTGLGQRPKEPRRRILISSQYERKIDQIEVRLGNIEALLRNQTTAQQHPPADHSRPVRTPKTGSSIFTAASTAEYESSDNESALGGDSGLAAQTAFASEFLEHAVDRTSLRNMTPTMPTALANLRQLVEIQKHRSISHGPRFPLQRPVPPGGLSTLPMPPMEAVASLLEHAKTAPPSLFTLITSLAGLSDFDALCHMAYFPTEDFSHATFIIVNSGLYNLFMEQHSVTTDSCARENYLTYTRLCQANLETSIANLPLFLSVKIENVQALYLGALYFVDESRPSVAWQLSSTAAQLCQTGGFHRAECLSSDLSTVAQVKTILFWQIYTLDKGLSLRLGRTSVIQDCDITIPRDFNFEGFLHLEKSPIPQLWLEISALQGRIYKELYSPAALAAPPPELVQKARNLAVDCRRFETDVIEARDETVTYLKSLNSSDLIDIFVKGDEVQFHVTMTLIYRAIPAPEGSISQFSDGCLQSARKAMSTHEESIGLLHHSSYFKSIYVHWNLMLTPFAPFFVIFCYIIETSSLQDLKLLQDFVASIEPLRDASETVDKLYRLFQVMRDVALVYIEAKSQQQQDQTKVPIGDEFDVYLSQLGFIPTEDQAMDHANDAGGQVQGMGQTAQMADWFSGSRDIFRLLEEDLSQINPNRSTNAGVL